MEYTAEKAKEKVALEYTTEKVKEKVKEKVALEYTTEKVKGKEHWNIQ